MPNTDQRRSSPFKIRAMYGQYNMEKMVGDLLLGSRVGLSVNSPNTTHIFSLRQLGELRSRSLGLNGLIHCYVVSVS